MNIRFVIFLLTIFMVFMPCYGMQMANNTIASNNITQIQSKNIELKREKDLRKVKSIKSEVWEYILITFSIILCYLGVLFFVGSIGLLLISGLAKISHVVVLTYFFSGLALLVGGVLSLVFGKKLRHNRKQQKQK